MNVEHVAEQPQQQQTEESVFQAKDAGVILVQNEDGTIQVGASLKLRVKFPAHRLLVSCLFGFGCGICSRLINARPRMQRRKSLRFQS